jgi:succinyl-diaminopimelate desuccinylase
VELESFLTDVRGLLAIPSTADRLAATRRALDFVLDYVTAGGAGNFTVERFTSDGRRSALVYPGGQRPESFRVILNGHLDVVPAPDDQFRPRIDGGRLYARGAMDMKVSALLMARVFRELAPSLPYPAGLQLVTDEETGGYDGTRYQLGQGVTARFAITGESTGLDITTESKGMANVVLSAAGRNAHGAYPWLGDNALLKLTATIGRILRAYPVPDAEAWRTTVNVARIETPNTAYNQVPAAALAMLNIRFPAGDPDFDGATAEGIEEHLAGFCAPGVTAQVRRTDSPAHADTGSPEIAALQAAARAQGYGGGFLRRHGTGDARFYRTRGINAVSFGIGGEGQHGPREYGDISSFIPYYEALADFLKRLAGR